MARITWNATNLMGAFNANIVRGMTKAGMYFVSKVRQNVNREQEYKRYKGEKGIWYKGLDPSKEGEFPKKLTGQLQRSMAWKLDAGRLTLTMGSGLNYAGFLETGTKTMRPRPWLSTTWEHEKEKITRIIITGGG